MKGVLVLVDEHCRIMLVDEQSRVSCSLTSSHVTRPGGHFSTRCGDSEVWLVVTYYCAVLVRGDHNRLLRDVNCTKESKLRQKGLL